MTEHAGQQLCADLDVEDVSPSCSLAKPRVAQSASDAEQLSLPVGSRPSSASEDGSPPLVALPLEQSDTELQEVIEDKWVAQAGWGKSVSGHSGRSTMSGIEARELLAAVREQRAFMDKLLKRAVVAMLLVVVILFIASFGLTYFSFRSVEDMHSDNRGVLRTAEGQIVKVGSADYVLGADGTLRPHGAAAVRLVDEGGRRLCVGDESACEVEGNAVKTASASVQLSLSSTLPDAVFRELQYIVFESEGFSLSVKIEGFTRVRSRTGQCGSFVHLHCKSGRMTLDDKDLLADLGMQEFLLEAGLEGFQNAIGTFGRRLSLAGGLVGFFNFIEELQWNCESQPLERPEYLIGNSTGFRAKTRMKQSLDQPATAYSKFFFEHQDSQGDEDEGEGACLGGEEQRPILLPGFLQDGDAVHRVWGAEVVYSKGVEGRSAHFPMHPYWKHIALKKRGVKLTTTLEKGVGHFCEVELNTNAASFGDLDGSLMHFEFVGLHETDGLLLRHFRLRLLHEDPETGSRRLNPSYWGAGRRLSADNGSASNASNSSFEEPQLLALLLSGMLPDTLDYYDVDSDPSGARAAGTPYRYVFGSTVPGSTAWKETTFLEVTSLGEALDIQGVLRSFGVGAFDKSCKASGSNTVGSTVDEVLADAAAMGAASGSSAQPPGGMRPWGEDPKAILYHFEKLSADYKAQLDGATASKPLLKAREDPAWGFWSALLTHGDLVDEVSQLQAEDAEADNDNSSVTDTRRLRTASPASEPAGEDAGRAADGALVEDTDEELEEEPEGEGRRLWGGRRRRRRRRAATSTGVFSYGLEMVDKFDERLHVLNVGCDFDKGGQTFSLDINAKWDDSYRRRHPFRLMEVGGSIVGPEILVWPSPQVYVSGSGSIWSSFSNNMQLSSIGGSLGVELSVKVPVIGRVGVGFEVEAEASGSPLQLDYVKGTLTISVGCCGFSGRAFAGLRGEPIGSGSNVYKKWKVTLFVGYGIEAWFADYDKEIDVVSFNLGSR